MEFNLPTAIVFGIIVLIFGIIVFNEIRKKKQGLRWKPCFFLAQREGFEPSCACAQTDFESVR